MNNKLLINVVKEMKEMTLTLALSTMVLMFGFFLLIYTKQNSQLSTGVVQPDVSSQLMEQEKKALLFGHLPKWIERASK